MKKLYSVLLGILTIYQVSHTQQIWDDCNIAGFEVPYNTYAIQGTLTNTADDADFDYAGADCPLGGSHVDSYLRFTLDKTGLYTFVISQDNSNSNQATGNLCIGIGADCNSIDDQISGDIADDIQISCVTLEEGTNIMAFEYLGADAGDITVEIIEADWPEFSFEVIDPSCHPSNGTSSDGSVDLTVTVGSPFEYSWTGPNGFTSSSEDIDNLEEGSYEILVTNVFGCTAGGAAFLNSPQEIVITEDNATSNLNCNGDQSGEISITVSGGTLPDYSYEWSTSDGSGLSTSDEDQSGLGSGTYVLTVFDANGCSASMSWVINEPSALVCANVSKMDETDCGAMDGTITITASGGTMPYTYSIDGSNFSASNEFINLSAGTYTPVIKDDNGCEVSCNSISVGAPNTPSCSIADFGNVSCLNGTDGFISVEATGGSNAYTYTIDDSAGTSNMTGEFTNLPFGNYTITISDNANPNCTTSCTQSISEPSTSVACSVTSTAVQCFGEASGVITVTGSGGTGDLMYSIDGTAFQSSNIFSDLSADDYTITIMDENGCTSTCMTTVTEPAALSCTLSKVDVVCFGDNSGSITVTTTGGVSPYLYSIDGTNFQTSGMFSNLSAGSYTITTRDNNDCSNTCTTTLTQGDEIVLDTGGPYDPFCDNEMPITLEGTIDGGITDGVWTGPGITDNGNTATFDPTIAGVGTHTIIFSYIEVITNCSFQESVDIVVNGTPSGVLNFIDSSANNNNDGEACEGDEVTFDVTVSGGTPNYVYNWSGPNGFSNSNEDITVIARDENSFNPTEGNYRVIISNVYLCSDTIETSLTALLNPVAKCEILSEEPMQPFSFFVDRSFDLRAEFDINNNVLSQALEQPNSTLAYLWEFTPNILINGSSEPISAESFIDNAKVDSEQEYFFDLTVTDSNQCTDSESKAIVFNVPNSCFVSRVGNNLLCENEEVGGFMYNKSDGSALNNIEFRIYDDQGTYMISEVFTPSTSDPSAEIQLYTFMLEPGKYIIRYIIDEVDGCDEEEKPLGGIITVLELPSLIDAMFDAEQCKGQMNTLNIETTPSDALLTLIYNFDGDQNRNSPLEGGQQNFDINVGLPEGAHILNLLSLEHSDLTSCRTDLANNYNYNFNLTNCDSILNSALFIDREFYCETESVEIVVTDNIIVGGDELVYIVSTDGSFSNNELESAFDNNSLILSEGQEMFNYVQIQDEINYTFGNDLFVYLAINPKNGDDWRLGDPVPISFWPNPTFENANDVDACHNAFEVNVNASILGINLATKNEDYQWELGGNPVSSDRIQNEKLSSQAKLFINKDLYSPSTTLITTVTADWGFFGLDDAFTCSSTQNITINVGPDTAPDFAQIRWWEGNILACTDMVSCYQWGFREGGEDFFPLGLDGTNQNRFYYAPVTSDDFTSIGVPNPNRVYFVELSNQEDCQDAESCTTRIYYEEGFVFRSIEKEDLEITVFPNPSEGTFHISFNEPVLNPEFTLYNAVGLPLPLDNVLGSDQETLYTISQDLQKGIYFLQVKMDSDYYMVEKVIIH